MTRLQRTLLKEMTKTFILCTVSLLGLIIISRGLHMRELFLGLELGFVDTVRLFMYLVPLFMLLVIPVSCMLGVFLTFLRMSTDRELIALRAGGVSVYQMLSGPFFFSLACMVLGLFISIHGISWGMSSFRGAVLELANTRARVVLQPGIFNQDIFGLTLYAKKVDPVTGDMRQVLFEDRAYGSRSNLGESADGGRDAESRALDENRKNRRKDQISITILAPRGKIYTDENKAELVFVMNNGRIYRLESDRYSILNFEEYVVRISLEDIFKGVNLSDIKPKEMTWEALRRMDEEQNAPNPRFQSKVGMEIQKRMALPVAALVLGMFSIPLACAFEGAKRQLGVVLSLVMFLVYYAFFSVGMNVSESGIIHPVIGLWFANAVFAIAAVAGIYLTAKERFPSFRNLAAPLTRILKKRSGKGGAA